MIKWLTQSDLSEELDLKKIIIIINSVRVLVLLKQEDILSSIFIIMYYPSTTPLYTYNYNPRKTYLI